MGATPGQHAARRLRKKVKGMPTGLPVEQWRQWMNQIMQAGQQQRARVHSMVEPGSLAAERALSGIQPAEAQAIQAAQSQRAMFERSGLAQQLAMMQQGVGQQLGQEASTLGGIGQLGGLALGYGMMGRGGGGGFMGGFGQGAGQAAGQWAGQQVAPQQPQLTTQYPYG